MEEDNQKYNGQDSFVQRLEAHIEANLDNEQFGVEQLAQEIGISRSHLHRKLQKSVGKSISRFIREFRLERGRQLMIEKGVTVSEASHAVGFGSPSYFNTCFTEYYGYSPGKAKIMASNSKKDDAIPKRKPYLSWTTMLLWGGGLVIVFLAGFFIYPLLEKEDVAANPITDKSVIVLPFKNLSSDEENQYLAEGIVDAISRDLSGIQELQVKSSTALAQFKDKNMTLQQMGTALNVANMVQGSVQRQDDMLRIEVKLINASEENQLWAKNYDREFSDLLKIQSDIAENVASVLRANLSITEKSIIDKRSSYNPEAYDMFLKGRSYRGGDKRNVPYFKKAIALDSTMPWGYIGMAAQYMIKAALMAELDALEAFEKAKPYLDKALELDPDLKEAHGWKAIYQLYNDWDFKAAEEGYKIAMESGTHFFLFIYTSFLHNENRHDEGLSISRRLIEEYPHYPNNNLPLSYFFTQRYGEGREYIERRLLTFTNYNALNTSGFFMLNTGEYDKAIVLFQKILDREKMRLPRIISLMAAAYAKKGDNVHALEILKELKALKSKSNAGSPAFYIAIVHAALGEKEEALQWLKIAVDDHEMDVPWLVSEPQLYPLHNEPAFAALVKQVGFRSHAYPVELPPEVK